MFSAFRRVISDLTLFAHFLKLAGLLMADRFAPREFRPSPHAALLASALIGGRHTDSLRLRLCSSYRYAVFLAGRGSKEDEFFLLTANEKRSSIFGVELETVSGKTHQRK